MQSMGKRSCFLAVLMLVIPVNSWAERNHENCEPPLGEERGENSSAKTQNNPLGDASRESGEIFNILNAEDVDTPSLNCSALAGQDNRTSLAKSTRRFGSRVVEVVSGVIFFDPSPMVRAANDLFGWGQIDF